MKIYFSFIVAAVIALEAAAQSPTAEEIMTKCHTVIKGINSGDFTFTFRRIRTNNTDSPATTDTTFDSGDFIFYKDSVGNQHTANFFFKQHDDTTFVYDGKCLYKIDKNKKHISFRKVEPQYFSITPIEIDSETFGRHLIFFLYLRKTSFIPKISVAYPNIKLQGIEKIDGAVCYKITSESTSNAMNDQVFKEQRTFFIDTSSSLIRKEIFDSDLGDEHSVTDINISPIRPLKEGAYFKFDVNDLSKQYTIEELPPAKAPTTRLTFPQAIAVSKSGILAGKYKYEKINNSVTSNPGLDTISTEDAKNIFAINIIGTDKNKNLKKINVLSFQMLIIEAADTTTLKGDSNMLTPEMTKRLGKIKSGEKIYFQGIKVLHTVGESDRVMPLRFIVL